MVGMLESSNGLHTEDHDNKGINVNYRPHNKVMVLIRSKSQKLKALDKLTVQLILRLQSVEVDPRELETCN